ncbi:MAG: LysR family transcriptional regulator [Clostridiales bacterium]|nr:MAG: LysR family transcriptional regulator [Clostridiales bacterium]
MLSVKLNTLLTVAEQQNFTKAAEQLSLTQPAVSHHISQLEEEFGVSLFIRGKSGLKLTQEGETVVRCARRMSALYEKLLTDLANIDKQITKLRVGITHTAESNLTAEVLAKCSGAENGLSITIVTDVINNLYDMLENYEIDLAIAEGNYFEPAFNSVVLDTDFLVCIVSTENPLAENTIITLEQLKKEQLILRLPASATRILFDSTLRSINDSPENYNIAIEVDNIATIKDLVRKDLGVSVLPKSSCIKELRSGKLAALPIENLSMVRETRIVYGKDFLNKDILQKITKVYQETMKEFR